MTFSPNEDAAPPFALWVRSLEFEGIYEPGIGGRRAPTLAGN